MKNRRPVWFSPLSISLPIGGVVSLLHRLSGVFLFLLLPLFLYLLQESLASPQRYLAIAAQLGGWLKFCLILLGWVVLHHVLAGVRLMLMDIGIGKELPTARRSAWMVLILALPLLAAWGGWLC